MLETNAPIIAASENVEMTDSDRQQDQQISQPPAEEEDNDDFDFGLGGIEYRSPQRDQQKLSYNFDYLYSPRQDVINMQDFWKWFYSNPFEEEQPVGQLN